jgi:phosphoribosylglycinamide formyltransferase-1/phosphoribosylamine--glycine ligase/phosphoribosylglycinamide formyltransferase/phosphoribosylformylglycinamidine cyclo-ligase
VQSTLERQRELVEADPEKFYRPPYLGPRGWVALRLDQGRVDWDEVADLLVAAWRLQAPKSLLDE